MCNLPYSMVELSRQPSFSDPQNWTQTISNILYIYITQTTSFCADYLGAFLEHKQNWEQIQFLRSMAVILRTIDT